MVTRVARGRRVVLQAALAAAGAAAGCATRGDAAGQPGAPAVSVRPDRDPELARHVLNRFAYGPRPGEVERVAAGGVDAWIEGQLGSGVPEASAPLAAALAPFETLAHNHTVALKAFAQLQREVLQPGTPEPRRAQAREDLDALIRRVQGQARQARLLDALYADRQLEAVLTEVWFNHFNVFAGKETVRITAGYHEREAIRPHVLGRFRDLLGATARHPAMLNYLDNWQSVRAGFAFPPGTPLPAGFRAPRGPNENYARELLELHTLGVDGGYTQDDVSELARVLTGWSFDRRDPGPEHAFRFYPARHDTGPKRLLGRAAPGGGQQEGDWALDLLARHPSTARHVARRLSVAFVADAPPPALVDRLTRVFIATDGDLREVMRALAASGEFRDPAVFGAKFKAPYRYVVSSVRAIGAAPADVQPLVRAVAAMGMPIHGCPTPDGWKDTREAWLGPEALRQRVAFAARLGDATRSGTLPLPAGAPRDAIDAALGPAARAAVAGAPPAQRLGVALATPDFMRT
jgi:uncharacterized protein (DUF1800 family)